MNQKLKMPAVHDWRRMQTMPYQQQIVDPFWKGTSQLKPVAGFVLDGITIPSTTVLRRSVTTPAGTVIGRKPHDLTSPLKEIHSEGKIFEPVP